MLHLAICAIGEADAALDVCCGTGAGMQFLRPICRRKVVGIDFSRGMLQQAKRKFEKAEGSPNVEFVELDVMDMTFQEEFDVATCFGALGHIVPGEETAFLRVVHRALKPGGRFVFNSAWPPPLLSLRSLLLRSFDATIKLPTPSCSRPLSCTTSIFFCPGLPKN